MLILGFTCQAWAGWEMAQFDLNLTTWDVAWTSWLQGLGVGLLWVPVTLVTFATLDARYISDGMGIFHLLRNIGSSIFISLSVALVIRSAKINYADMTTYINPYNEAFAMEGVSGAWTIDNTAGLAALSGEISRQAAMIGYVNSFYLFTWTSLAVIPLILLIRWKR
jgi:DHA2 family multidrug resistance protein